MAYDTKSNTFSLGGVDLLITWLLRALGITVIGGTAGIAATEGSRYVVIKLLAGGIEVAAGLSDVVGYLFFIAFILGWRKGGERVAILWPMSIIMEVVAQSLWDYKA